MNTPKPGSVYTYTISQQEADDDALAGVSRTGNGTLQPNGDNRWKLVLDQEWTPMEQEELALGSTADVTKMLEDGTLKLLEDGTLKSTATAAAAAAGRRRKTRRRKSRARKSRARKSRRSRK